MKHVELDYDDWEKQFGPLVSNPFCNEYHCTTFETYGQELAFVQDVYDSGVFGVWTLMDDDNGNTCISEGMATVNRIAYLITRHTYPTDTFFFIRDN